MGVIAETADRVAVMYAGRVVEVGPVESVIERPRHPYTAGLMASIPSVHRRNSQLKQIDGVMPRLDAIPPGCAFHPRCGSAVQACRERAPVIGTERHAVACYVPLVEAAHG
jgi:peptide/nickel transport system ATP-binding protein